MSIKHFQMDTGIMEIQQTGIVNLDTIRLHYQEIMTVKMLPNHLKILIDCSKAQFDMDISEIVKIAGYLKHAMTVCAQLSEAIVVNQPYETAVTTLYYDTHSGLPNYQFQVFSTREAAIEWLKSV